MSSRRQMLEFLSLSRLPSVFQEVEYIESSGTQYIDTLYVLNTPCKAQYSFMITGNVANGHSIAGVYNDDTGNDLYFGLVRSADSKLNYRYANVFYPSSTTIQQNVKYSAEVQLNVGNQYLLLNGVTEAFSSLSSVLNNSRNLYIMAINNAVVGKLVGRIYYFKIYYNNTLVRDFVPCYRKADNVAGLYDLVNGVFYTNAGTGTFIVGGNV